MTKSHRALFRFFVFCCFLWCTGILIAPLARHQGFFRSSSLLYGAYHCVCHQQDSRSFHIAGEQFGVCVRCSAIYGSFLVSLLCYPLILRWRRKLQGAVPLLHTIPSARILVITLFFMAVDAWSGYAGLYESTIATRLITGSSLGLVLPWYLVPVLLDASSQVYRKLQQKLLLGGE